jgi:hypothetical protein
MEGALQVLEKHMHRDPTFLALFKLPLQPSTTVSDGSSFDDTRVTNDDEDLTNEAVRSEGASAAWCTALLQM